MAPVNQAPPIQPHQDEAARAERHNVLKRPLFRAGT
jgi:hypothetical protein